VRLVVVDELQMLADPQRGATLELVLLKLVGAPSPPQLIALSAVLGDASRLSDWLRSELLLDKRRPVELREGVYSCEDGRFHYTCFNTGEEGHEPLALPDDAATELADEGFGREALLRLAGRLAQELDEQVLVFVPTRAMSRGWAFQMAHEVEFDPVEPALAELETFEPTHARDLMRECLRRAVAYHNAELSWEMRRLIEQYYNSGAIRILFSTSTLGQGVNLSGRNVLHVGEMVTSDTWTGQMAFVPLARDRFRNQGGRGARFGRESRFGRSILIARDDAERRRLARIYLEGDEESLPPPLAGRRLDGIICDLVASGVARTRDDVGALLEGSYTAAISWSADLPQFRRELARTIGDVVDKQFVVEREDGRLEASGLGRVVAVQGIQPTTALRFARWFRELGNRRPNEAELLLIASLTPDADDYPIPLSARERASPVYGAAVAEIIGTEAQTDDFLRQAIDPPGGWTESQIAALKKCLVLHRWIGPNDTEVIEEESGMFSGTINSLAQHFQWLVQALGAVVEALGGRKALVARADRLALRLHYGVEPRCLSLAALKVEAMTRGYLRALVREGFDSIQAVAETDPATLAHSIPQRVADELVRRARHALELEAERREKRRAAEPARRPGRKRRTAAKQIKAQPGLPRLLFDRDYPERVWVDDREVELTPYPYDLLRLLAERSGQLATYQEIDEALWPDAKVEPQQISAHKRSVVQALAKVVGPEKAKQTVETIPRRGLRLNLPADNIHWRR
jgi:helicase